MNRLTCVALGAAALAAGCQSGFLGPVEADDLEPPPQPRIEPIDELMPEKAFGPTGSDGARRRLVAHLALSSPNDGYSIFITDVNVTKVPANGTDLWLRCQTVYVASTRTFGARGAFMRDTVTCGAGMYPAPWPGLELRQISCDHEPQLTAGTVDVDLDAVRLTFSSGAVRTHRLDGPLLRNARHRRVFLLDHGALEWKLAEGLDDGRAVTSEAGSHHYCG